MSIGLASGTSHQVLSKSPESALALVAVGVDFYPEAKVPSLSCAANDADSLYKLLTSRRRNTLSWLLVNEDVTPKSLQQTIVDAARRVPEGTLLVTFSGHGCPSNRGGSWEAAFLTSRAKAIDKIIADSSDAEKQGAFTFHDVKRWLREAGCAPRNIVFLMDSCASGVSIRHDPSEDLNKGPTFEGQRAIARSLGHLHVETIKPQQVQLDKETGGLTWPPGSNVFIMAATKDGGHAYELPTRGQGVFTLAVLEWLDHHFLAGPERTWELSTLRDYVAKRIAVLKHADGSPAGDLQSPDCQTHSTVQISNQDVLNRRGIAHNLFAFARAMPVPERPQDRGTFEPNKKLLADALGKQIGNDDPPGDANIVVEFSRFSGTRALLKAVAEEAARRGDARRSLCFTWGSGAFGAFYSWPCRSTACRKGSRPPNPACRWACLFWRMRTPGSWTV